MLAAAAKEGKVVWYSSIDVKVAELIAKAFRADYPNIPDRGRAIGIGACVPADQPGVPVGHQERDVVNSSDASHFIYWKQQKWLAAHTRPT